MTIPAQAGVFRHRHLLGIEGLNRLDIESLLDMAEQAVAVSRRVDKKRSDLRGRTQINLFFENSTRTQASFELAGKRLGAEQLRRQVDVHLDELVLAEEGTRRLAIGAERGFNVVVDFPAAGVGTPGGVDRGVLAH